MTSTCNEYVYVTTYVQWICICELCDPDVVFEIYGYSVIWDTIYLWKDVTIIHVVYMSLIFMRHDD